ncbi:MAG: hypothetical protein U0235_26865 [Polyangiaceae bacterium]
MRHQERRARPGARRFLRLHDLERRALLLTRTRRFDAERVDGVTEALPTFVAHRRDRLGAGLELHADVVQVGEPADLAAELAQAAVLLDRVLRARVSAVDDLLERAQTTTPSSGRLGHARADGAARAGGIGVRVRRDRRATRVGDLDEIRDDAVGVDRTRLGIWARSRKMSSASASGIPTSRVRGSGGGSLRCLTKNVVTSFASNGSSPVASS